MDNARKLGTKTISDAELSPIEMMIVLAKRKKLILGLPFAAAVISAAISLSLPNVYKATVKLLPPQQSQNSAVALLAQLGGVASAAAGAAGLKNPNDLYVGMLKSRTIADKLIARFNLKDVYETETLDKTRLHLDKYSEITSGKDGLITIDVLDHDPKRVADMANAYAAELVDLSNELAVSDAAQRRQFFAGELEKAKNNLARAEMTLKRTLDAKGVVSVDEASRATLETSAKLRAQVSAKEIELNSMRAFVTPNNPDFKRTQEELNSVRAELSKLESGRDTDSEQKSQDVKSSSGLESIRVLRDVRYYQMLYDLLAKQYEAARLDEGENSSVVQVLDSAVVPEERDQPKRTIIVLISTVVGLIAAIAWAFIAESNERAIKDPVGAAQLEELKSHLRMRKRS